MDKSREKQFSIETEHHTLQLTLNNQCLTIKVMVPTQEHKIFQTLISKDSFPQNIKNIFENIEDLYKFITDKTPEHPYQLSSPNELNLIVYIGIRKRNYVIYLSERQLNRQEILSNKVKKLELELIKFREMEIKVKREKEEKGQLERKGGNLQEKVVALERENEKMRQLNISLTSQVRRLKQKISTGQSPQLSKKVSSERESEIQILKQVKQEANGYKQEIMRLQQKNTDLKNQLNRVRSNLESVEYLMEELTTQSTSSRMLIKEMTQQSQVSNISKSILFFNPEGDLLPFHPLSNSINRSSYEMSNNILKKNSLPVSSKQGRLISCAASIPTAGRYFYKIRPTKVEVPFNIGLGFTGRPNLESQSVFEGINDDMILYSSRKGSEVIYQGTTVMQGFSFRPMERLIIVIDQDNKEIEWHLQGDHLFTSKLTPLMKTAAELFFFIQLYNNGDQIQFMAS